MVRLHIDFESRSVVDLTETGTHIYARHPSTDIWCMSYFFDGDKDVAIWKLGEPLPERVRRHATLGHPIVAHNAAFEHVMWNELAVTKYGWPKVKIEQMFCTMAQAYAMSLPGSLANAAAALGLDTSKDMEGRRLMLQMAKPRRKEVCPICEGFGPCGACTDGTINVWWDDEGRLNRLHDYCKQDTRTESALDDRMMQLTPHERDVWVLDQKINERGVAIDVHALTRAISLIEHETERFNLHMRRVTDNIVTAVTNTNQLTDFLRMNGVETGGVSKDAVVDLLKQDLPASCRRALLLRQESGKSSVAKLQKILSGVSAPDYRLRGLFQYHGASTGRWAGRRIQPHNLPRPKMSHDQIAECFGVLVDEKLSLTEVSDHVDNFYCSPFTAISDMLRGLIIPAKGYDLIAGDFSAIEARGLAWLAGEESILDVFRDHGKIYELAASTIYGVPLDQVTKAQRQIGKVAILALGYQGGVGAFQNMATNYGVKISDMEADEIKCAWREGNPNIVRYWNALENAAVNAVAKPGATTKCGPRGREIKFKTAGSFLWCRLPSGRTLCYPYPTLEQKKTPWGELKTSLAYKTCDSQRGGKWQRTHTYGGKLAENITQAFCRDLLADALLRLEENKYPVVLHVHDEGVSEIKEGFGSVEEYEKIMEVVPTWAKDMPIKVEGWRDKRYRK